MTGLLGLATPTGVKRVIIAGYGRIGQNIAQGLHDAGIPFIVIDIDPERIAEARANSHPSIYGDASNSLVLSQAGLKDAGVLVVAFPDPLAVIGAVRAAHEINPKLKMVARVHRAHEAEALRQTTGVDLVSPEYEASIEFLRRILTASGWKKIDIRRTLPFVKRNEKFVEFTADEQE